MPKSEEKNQKTKNHHKWYYDQNDVMIFLNQLKNVELWIEEILERTEDKDGKDLAEFRLKSVITAQSAIREMAEQQRVMVIAIEKLKNN